MSLLRAISGVEGFGRFDVDTFAMSAGLQSLCRSRNRAPLFMGRLALLFPLSFALSQNRIGLDATVGYVGWANRPENEESAMTELLRELGAVLFVKTNVPGERAAKWGVCPEREKERARGLMAPSSPPSRLASLMAPETYNNIYGYTPTPLNRKLSAGGSSGGEGALIAMRGSPLGVGTDIGGSVRIPAACNNLFGLRPSFGRFPTEGHRSGEYRPDLMIATLGTNFVPFASHARPRINSKRQWTSIRQPGRHRTLCTIDCWHRIVG